MKFGRQLEDLQVPEWREHYFDYKCLKRTLAELASAASQTSSADLALGSPTPNPSGQRCSSLGSTVRSPRALLPTSVQSWLQAVERETVRVNAFITQGLRGLRERADALIAFSESQIRSEVLPSDGCPEAAMELPSSGQNRPMTKEEQLRLYQTLGRLKAEIQQLRRFVELNHVAVFKLLKKHDKLLKTKTGLHELLPRLAGGRESILGESLCQLSYVEASLAPQLRRAALAVPACRGLGDEASAEMLQLATGVFAVDGAHGHTPHSRTVADPILMFFLGSSTALILAIFLLIGLPPEKDTAKPFSIVYFLTPFCVFRFSFCVIMTLWCIGAVVRCCDDWEVNHSYLLGLDPRSRVGANYFFKCAGILTSIWVVLFGMYVVDYKWMLFPEFLSAHGYNNRSSLHFVFYPAGMLLALFTMVAWPSRICRGKYKASLAMCLARTAVAPFCAVSFADNIVGDVLTSLAKPLQDIAPVLCYIFSAHPQTEEHVHKFRHHGNTCPTWVAELALPIIGGAPFWFRAMQCARRFRDTKESKHMLNFGKYVASLLVVVVTASSLQDSSLAVFGVSAIATLYAFAWDVTMDWGLTRSTLFRGEAASLQQRQREADSAVFFARTPPALSAHQRPPQSDVRRVFKRRHYLVAACIDFCARVTWVNTLMPISLVTNDIVNREIVKAAVSAIEIIRRAMWAIIRIEYEQVSNAAGFRALLWVPAKAVQLSSTPWPPPTPHQQSFVATVAGDAPQRPLLGS